jgi:hypothetical protein
MLSSLFPNRPRVPVLSLSGPLRPGPMVALRCEPPDPHAVSTYTEPPPEVQKRWPDASAKMLAAAQAHGVAVAACGDEIVRAAEYDLRIGVFLRTSLEGR